MFMCVCVAMAAIVAVIFCVVLVWLSNGLDFWFSCVACNTTAYDAKIRPRCPAGGHQAAR